ncbi:kinase-like protein [Trichodelitschia bisporula]|uniref:non-specific serine/threonine protein kinase n=1 Tax=Trichodelitschia bisporula TaxID=703511 RepID=A0A6G1I9M2_9PEZI|nr:kinase-like protein [Trichodelitschia bisporula]
MAEPIDQYGLQWVEGRHGFSTEPKWTRYPHPGILEAIVREVLQLDLSPSCRIHLEGSGSYNRMYGVQTDKAYYVFRVTLPVDPYFKTASEVATLKWLHQNTDIPVPKVLAHEASSHNELGFEWMLLEYKPGTPLRKKWRDFSMEVKTNIIKQLAAYQAQLYGKKFAAVGNLYMRRDDTSIAPDARMSVQTFTGTSSSTNDSSKPPASVLQKIVKKLGHSQYSPPVFEMGPIVSSIFFHDENVNLGIPRGPFKSSEEWISNHLAALLASQEIIAEKAAFVQEVEQAHKVKAVAQQAFALVSDIFKTKKPEETSLVHRDLTLDNILVTDQGDISAIIDWEAVPCLPAWRAASMPSLLRGPVRKEKPNARNFKNFNDAKTLDDPTLPEVLYSSRNTYWAQVFEHEKTLLRDVYEQEMSKLQPSWAKERKAGIIKMSFFSGLDNAHIPRGCEIFREWLTCYKVIGDKIWNIDERIYGGL